MIARPYLAALALSQRRSIATTIQDVPLDALLEASEVIKVRMQMSSVHVYVMSPCTYRIT